jgi:hypothetical protein
MEPDPLVLVMTEGDPPLFPVDCTRKWTRVVRE